MSEGELKARMIAEKVVAFAKDITSDENMNFQMVDLKYLMFQLEMSKIV